MLPTMADRPLAGLAEIATAAGVTKRTASRYTIRTDFPQPISVLAMGPVWDLEQVNTWLRSSARRPPGRPPAPKTGERPS